MVNRKIVFGIIILLLLIISIYIATAQIYLGTVEGYIFNRTGSLIIGADVIVNISGCSGSNCGGSTQSDAGGYYVITNLNLNPGETVSVEANKTGDYGNNTGIADAYQTAYLNVTIAKVPGTPTVVPNPDTHNNTIIYFNWTSGIDPEGLTIYDILVIEGVTYNNVTSPYNLTDVTFKVYDWNVKTCNAYGCSAEDSDSFSVYNNAPPSPSLDAQGDNVNTTRTLNWSSGGADPDGDSTYFEFQMDSDSVQSNVIPPINQTLGFGSHTWKVRECDSWTCSSWATDTFLITNNAPSSPTLTDQIDLYSPEIVTLQWTSGIDPDGHSTYDEYRFNGTLSSNVTSPQTEDLTGIIDYFVWEVRTCDVNGACSSWVNDTFIKYICPAPAWTQ